MYAGFGFVSWHYKTLFQVHFRLRDLQTRASIMDAMSVQFFSGGTTDTAGALRYMREDMFRTGNSFEPVQTAWYIWLAFNSGCKNRKNRDSNLIISMHTKLG